jgi:hypothetical protein
VHVRVQGLEVVHVVRDHLTVTGGHCVAIGLGRVGLQLVHVPTPNTAGPVPELQNDRAVVRFAQHSKPATRGAEWGRRRRRLLDVGGGR